MPQQHFISTVFYLDEVIVNVIEQSWAALYCAEPMSFNLDDSDFTR